MSKRIGIDARWITPEVSGIGRYTERLIHALAQIDRDNQYFIFKCHPEPLIRHPERSEGSSQNFKTVLFPYSPFSLRGFFLLPRLIRKYRLDLFHSTNFMLPLLARRVKLIATVHDLIPLIHPEMTPKAKKTRLYPLYWLLMRWIARKADLLIGDSDHSCRDLIRALKLPPEKVRRVYVGIEDRFKPADQPKLAAAYKRIAGIAEPYFLYTGRHDPYKNISGLVQAYAKFLAFRAKPSPQLVITGKPDPRYPEAREWCEANKLNGQVIFTGHVTDEELLALYQHARGVVLVSRYEGFGLPVLEAMACGVPVLCSKAASLPEVAGDAALLVNPNSVDEIAEGLRRLQTDEPFRRNLIQKGRLQARKFSWQTCARETLQAYNDLLS